jgi:Glycosyl transferase family 2
MSNSPAMSVVLVSPGESRVLDRVIRDLQNQTVNNLLELVIVTPSAADWTSRVKDLREFCKVQLVEIGDIRATGQAMAEGFRRCTGPVVVYVEEHSYPEPGWAEILIRAHQGPWAGVGWSLVNANPTTMTSWAAIYTDFGPWLDPTDSRECPNLPSHHSSYKREALLEFGPSLGALLEPSLILDRELRARGQKLYLESAAKSHHVNCSRLRSHLRSEFLGGRLFGFARATYQHWTTFRKLVYACAMPLVPLVRLWRVWAQIRQTGRQRRLLPRILPPLMSGLAAHALGETVGYLFGPGDAAQGRRTIELTRYRHLVEQDRCDDAIGGNRSGSVEASKTAA